MEADGSEVAETPTYDYDVAMVRSIFDSMRDYMCVHRPVLNEQGRVIDCELLSWNAAYENVRTKKVVRGQRISDTYFLPESALAHVNTAWSTGHSYQLFRLNKDDGDRYRPAGSEVAIEVQWQRAGDLVLEIGSDLSEFQRMQRLLQQHEAEVAYSEQAIAIAEERDRIARELHDSVIQNLFAISLTIDNIASSTSDTGTGARLATLRGTVTEVINEIRREIFDVRNPDDETVEQQVNSVTRQLCEATGVVVTVKAEVGALSTRLRTNMRAVIREATSNAVRHGKALNISIDISDSGGILNVLIENDGLPLPEDEPRNSGTMNLARRAELLGGVMSLTNTSDGHVQLSWRVPIEHGDH